jgi:hypothetical protein
MADQSHANLSSVFDGMLTQSKKQLDDLYRGSRGGVGGLAKTAAAIFGGENGVPAASRSTPPADFDDGSSAASRLRERYGSDWHYEIKERHRDGDEAIVLGKLTFGKQGGIRTQFGRAKISGAAVTGASSGVQFRIGEGGSARDEHDAFRRASEAALASCIALI